MHGGIGNIEVTATLVEHSHGKISGGEHHVELVGYGYVGDEVLESLSKSPDPGVIRRLSSGVYVVHANRTDGLVICNF